MKISEPLPALAACAASDVGRVRSTNEDAYICDPDRGLFAVIDGVGGQAGGDVAAAIARRELELRLRRETGSIDDRIREAIAAANASIVSEAQRVPALSGMACVLTVAVVAGERLVIGHVGDTRLYKIGPTGMRKLTHDHSPVGQLEDGGRLGEEEAMRHPERNQVFREVGTRLRQPTDPEFIEIVSDRFGADEAILLCSDGLSDLITAGEIEQIVRRSRDSTIATADLIDAANHAGGKDNITVVLILGPAFGSPSRNSADTTELKRPPRASDVGRPDLAEAEGRRRVTSGPADDSPIAVRSDATDGPRPRSWRSRRTLLSIAALVVAVAIAGAAWWWGVPLITSIDATGTRTATSEIQPRVLRVSTAPDSTLTTIGAALAGAQAGDVIEVDAGTYTESVVLRDGVAVRARQPRSVVLQRPADVNGPWTAISGTDIRSGGISGFVVKGSDSAPLDYGVWIAGGSLDLDDLEIVGARSAAVQIGGRSTARLRGSDVHDNGGAGVLVERDAVPEILHNVIERNGRIVPTRGGIELRDGARAAIAGNIVRDNGQPGVVGLPSSEVGRVTSANALGSSSQSRTRR